MALKSETIISLIWKLLERAGNQIILLLVQIVMARLLTPEDFGLLAIIMVLVNLGTVFVQSGLGAALVQNPDVDESDFSTVFWISLAIALVLVWGIWLFAPVIGQFYSSNKLVWPMRILSLTMLLNALNSIQIARVQREMQFKKTFIATICSVFFSGFIGVGFALAGTGLWALVAQQLAYQAVNCVVMALQVKWRPAFVFAKKRALILFDFGWKILACNVISAGYQSMYDLIVGKHFSTLQLGFISQGKKYPYALGSMLDGAIQPVMMSAISKIQSDKARVKSLTRRSLKTSSFVVMPCMTLFALSADPIVDLVLGEQWASCVPFLQVYCFVYALLPISSSNLSALSGMGRSDVNLKLEILKKIVGTVLLLIGAFVFNDVYVLVLMALISNIIATFINSYPNKRLIGYSYFEQARDIIPGIVLSLVSAMFAWPVSIAGLPSIATILLQAFIMMGAYIALSKLFRVEAFQYLLITTRGFLGSRGASR